MASKIKVDQIEGSTGSTITIPTGQTFTVTDGIPVASGGTGLASFTAGDILYATGATTLTKLNKGTAEQVLAMNSGATAPDWGSVDLTVLPTITVAKGGTNIASFAAGDILYATGSTTLAKLVKGSAADVLTMNSGATAPEWAAAAGGGKVLQAVMGTSSSSNEGTETSFTDTGLNVTITPAATSSKILVMMSTTGNIGQSGAFTYITCERQISGGADTNIGDSTIGLCHMRGDSVNISPASFQALDSPSTVSAITYEVQRRVSAQSGGIIYQNVKSNITAIEIGA